MALSFQMTAEMSTLRNKRIELLKGMQGENCKNIYAQSRSELNSGAKSVMCFISRQCGGDASAQAEGREDGFHRCSSLLRLYTLHHCCCSCFSSRSPRLPSLLQPPLHARGHQAGASVSCPRQLGAGPAGQFHPLRSQHNTRAASGCCSCASVR